MGRSRSICENCEAKLRNSPNEEKFHEPYPPYRRRSQPDCCCRRLKLHQQHRIPGQPVPHLDTESDLPPGLGMVTNLWRSQPRTTKSANAVVAEVNMSFDGVHGSDEQWSRIFMLDVDIPPPESVWAAAFRMGSQGFLERRKRMAISDWSREGWP